MVSVRASGRVGEGVSGRVRPQRGGVTKQWAQSSVTLRPRFGEEAASGRFLPDPARYLTSAAPPGVHGAVGLGGLRAPAKPARRCEGGKRSLVDFLRQGLPVAAKALGRYLEGFFANVTEVAFGATPPMAGGKNLCARLGDKAAHERRWLPVGACYGPVSRWRPCRFAAERKLARRSRDPDGARLAGIRARQSRRSCPAECVAPGQRTV